MLVLAAWSHGQESAKPGPLSASDLLPEAPPAGLLDEGNVFNAEERVLVAAELEDFRHRVGLPAFVVTANYIFGNTVDKYGERLVTAWSKGKPGVVLLYERGSGQLNYSATPGALGRMEDMKALFLSASRASALMPDDATAAQHLRAALHGLTLSAETWKKTGTLPASASTPPAVASSAPGPSKTETLPAAPADFVMDDADAFNEASESALKTELITFHSKSHADIYVVTCTTLPDTSAELWAERLAREWLRGRHGAVLVMNRGTGTGERPLLRRICAAPAKNPALNLSEARQLEPQLESAVLQLLQLLGGMPAFLADVIGGVAVEPDDDLIFTLPRDHAKAVMEDFLD